LDTVAITLANDDDASSHLRLRLPAFLGAADSLAADIRLVVFGMEHLVDPELESQEDYVKLLREIRDQLQKVPSDTGRQGMSAPPATSE
jgi:hypothetical protein